MAAIIANENVRNLVPYVAGKPIEEVERELGISNIIKLASNESPLGPSPKALEAARKARDMIRMDPEGSCFVLRDKLTRHLDVPANTLMFGNGSDDLIHNLGLAFLQSGDEVVTGAPTFVQYRAAAILNGAKYIEVPLKNHAYDLDALGDALTDRTRIVFIANPNNPTGTANSAQEIERLLDRVSERTIVVLDEAYYEYVERPDYPQSIRWVLDGRNVVVLRTFSKIFALAGLRVGYGIADPEIASVIDQVREPFNVNTIAQYAAAASIDDPDQVKRNRELNQAGKLRFYKEFERLGLEYVPSEANFVYVDLGRDAAEVGQALLRKGVIIRTGKLIGSPTCARVTIGTSDENDRFLRALGEVLC
ncbi:MAG: histidinol-phosphate transaminase [Armatimonadota bacterium]